MTRSISFSLFVLRHGVSFYNPHYYYCIWQYAPDVPWDEPQVLDLFQQMTRQLGNLATKSSSSSEESSRSSNPFLQHYLHMLRQLAEVKIGCILVDLVNNQIENQVDPTNSESEEDDDDDQEDSDGEIKGKKRSKPNTLGKARRRTTALRAPPTRDSALDILVEFLTTLMHGVRREHPSEVLSLVEGAISSTLSDYHPGIQVPIPVLDVLLRCIGQGPTQSIVVQKQQFAKHTSASKRAAAAAAVQQVQVANPTYQVAAKVIQTMLNKIAEPISQLLNGLLNGDPHYVDQSSIRCIIASDFTEPEPSPPLANNKRKTKGSRLVPFDLDSDDNEVFHIVYELHRVAPQILTTVLGTVGRGLSSTLAKQRYQTVLLMGRLFSSEYANLAHEYAASFRDWLGRKNDMESRIRVCMVQQCMAVLSRHCATDTPGADSFKRTKTLSSPLTNAASADPEIAMAVADALRVLVTLDLSLDVRLEGIHLLCDWAYKENCASSAISASILQTVGSRVSAKHKQERKDAVTGLAHVFYRHGLQSQLQAVTSGGDDCDPSLVAQTIHEMCPFLVDSAATKSDLRKRHRKDDHDPYRWIPIKVLECACFTDAVDTEMRSRVIYIVDDLLLTGGSPKKMSPTCRALAWTTLVDTMTGNDGILSLLNSSSTSHKRINAFKHLQRLLRTRAVLQQKVSMYIDTRLKIGESASGKILTVCKRMEMSPMSICSVKLTFLVRHCLLVFVRFRRCHRGRSISYGAIRVYR